MQGRIVTKDLAQNGYKIFVSDFDQELLDKLLRSHPELPNRTCDLRDFDATVKLIKEIKPTVVINCAEGSWNVEVYQAALAADAHVIDLGSDLTPTQKQIEMDEDFKKAGLTAITGCGSTPGINNITLSHVIRDFDYVETIETGFAWTSDPKVFVVPFSMESILEEFTGEAPFIEDKKWSQEDNPMEGTAKRRFKEIGSQIVFLVGHHAEPYTFFIYHKDKGVKNIKFYAGFPPHSFNKIKEFIGSGITGENENRSVNVDGKGLVPLSSLTKVLQEIYPPPVGYTEKENLWVSIEGMKDGKRKEVFIECIVPTLPGWEFAGCNVDTGLPASIIAQMIFNGEISERGSFGPGPVIPAEQFFKELAKRQMKIYIDDKLIN